MAARIVIGLAVFLFGICFIILFVKATSLDQFKIQIKNMLGAFVYLAAGIYNLEYGFLLGIFMDQSLNLIHFPPHSISLILGPFMITWAIFVEAPFYIRGIILLTIAFGISQQHLSLFTNDRKSKIELH